MLKSSRHKVSGHMVAAFALLGAGACVESSPHDLLGTCENGKCDSGALVTPRCTPVPGTGLATPVYPGIAPGTFVYVPQHFVIDRIVSHYSAYNLDVLSTGEQNLSPYVSERTVQVALSLAPAEDEDTIRRTLQARMAPGAPAIVLAAADLETAADDPLQLQLASPVAAPAMTSRRAGGLTFESLATLPAGESAHYALLGLLRRRTGILSASIPATLACVDDNAAASSRELNLQTTSFTLAAPGIEMHNGPQVVEWIAGVMRGWQILRRIYATSIALGTDDDLPSRSAHSHALLTPVLGYGNGQVTAAMVNEAGTAVRASVVQEYGRALERLGVAAPADLDAHLRDVAAGAPKLTVFDDYFVMLYQDARRLATFAPAIDTLVDFE